ncbi:hypothetical protein P3T76_002817 [Phytophthora citrophthora]|uniref:Zinc finger PHD-type domain-containing protein n=1 Tax=Phytophthora citrophthora TaxID=4793 RepID=A0AAD9GWB2_9STRA|nr:hypothetical protein P3T76_002817 [Phytophthora citrophthora]
MPKETEATDASIPALKRPAAPTKTEKDAHTIDASNDAPDVVMEDVDPENSGGEQDAASGAQDVDAIDAVNAPKIDKNENRDIEEQSIKCSECQLAKSATRGDTLRVCVGCKLVVHEKCYASALPLTAETKETAEVAVEEKVEKGSSSSDWKCDCCQRGVERAVTACVYCGKPGGDKVLKVVEMSEDTFWNQCSSFEEKETVAQFGHVLCINWDPRRLAAHVVMESKIKPAVKVTKKELKAAAEEAAKKAATEDDTEEVNGDTEEKSTNEEPEDAVPDGQEVLMRDWVSPGSCCFCQSNSGVRIQCRRVNCSQFFHAMCAHEGNGHVELRTGHILQFHAYCERHRNCTEDIGDLLAKLITRPIRLLVGRDDMRRFGTVAKHLPEYTSAAAVIRDLAALAVGYCNKGLRANKSESPDYNVKHLQVLQFFLSHVPQLEKIYALPPTTVQDLVNDKKLFRRLERMFDPSRYLTKYPGPFSQQYTCDVCLDPFHERQHLFYCSKGDESGIPHVQHWRCTKRRSNVRERERYLPAASSTGAKKKRKAISIVQDGARKDITLPKSLPSMTDDIICGVCRAAVDARGLIASRKEAKCLDFEKKESKFVQNGCYINPSGAKGYHGYSYGTGSNSASRKPPRSTDGKPNGSSIGQHAAAQQALGPPKMERINVQRTTRWLSCVAQIIRQAGVPAPKAAATTPSTAPPITTKSPIKPAANGSTSNGVVTAGSVGGNSQGVTIEAGSSTSAATVTTPMEPATNGVIKAEPEAEKESMSAITPTSNTRLAMIKSVSLVTPAMQALFDEAMRLVRPYDAYALAKLESAYDMFVHRSGPGVAVLRMLTHEYTRFVYIKHTRAVEKARNEKRKRAEHQAQENREKERKRMNQEAERALKKQMLAMRNKQRQHLKATSSK